MKPHRENHLNPHFIQYNNPILHSTQTLPHINHHIYIPAVPYKTLHCIVQYILCTILCRNKSCKIARACARACGTYPYRYNLTATTLLVVSLLTTKIQKANQESKSRKQIQKANTIENKFPFYKIIISSSSELQAGSQGAVHSIFLMHPCWKGLVTTWTSRENNELFTTPSFPTYLCFSHNPNNPRIQRMPWHSVRLPTRKLPGIIISCLFLRHVWETKHDA